MATQNLKPKLDYDNEADVLYVNFGTNEPSYCEPINEFLLLEVGMFTSQPTGFRIIQPRKKNIKKIAFKIKKIIRKNIETQQKTINETFKQIEKIDKPEKLVGIT